VVESLRELHRQQSEILSQVETLKKRAAELQGKILAATAERVNQMYALSGKQHGTVSVAGEDGVTIKGSIGKKVEWDSPALMGVASALPWETVQKVFKIEFGVPEKMYAKLAEHGITPEQIVAIDAARTTKYEPLKVSLEVSE